MGAAEVIMAGVEQGTDVVVMHNALLALRKLCKKFEYKVGRLVWIDTSYAVNRIGPQDA
jgi:hypothetical protein